MEFGCTDSAPSLPVAISVFRTLCLLTKEICTCSRCFELRNAFMRCKFEDDVEILDCDPTVPYWCADITELAQVTSPSSPPPTRFDILRDFLPGGNIKLRSFSYPCGPTSKQ